MEGFNGSWDRIKNSRLLAEFREHDSYLTSSDEEEDSSGCSSGRHCLKSAKNELTNSLIQMGHSLVSAAAAAQVAQNGFLPRVTLRLTRLRLDIDSFVDLQKSGLKTLGDVVTEEDVIDPRIGLTIDDLLAKGIEVILGEHEFVIPVELQDCSPRKEVTLIPSRDVNLDLSAVIALVSDVTHAPLPASEDEAYTRFIPTPAERARSRRRRTEQKAILAQLEAQAKASNESVATAEGKSGKSGRRDEKGGSEKSDAEDEDGDGVHSRALASQVLREMDTGLLSEISLRMQDAQSSFGPRTSTSPSENPSRFWSSKEVRDRCLRIVDKIGGPRERRRAAALFYSRSDKQNELEDRDSCLGFRFPSEEDAIDAYWLDSRHPRAMIPSLVPLHIFDEDLPPSIEALGHRAAVGNPFWDALNNACARLLASGSVSHPRDLVMPFPLCLTRPLEKSTAMHLLGEKGGDIARASVTRANPRLTVHTVETLAHSADPRRRWTTLTANRSSVREIMREYSRENASLREVASRCSGEHSSGLQSRGEETQESGKKKVAAIWMLEPRSLAEGMRGDAVPRQVSG